MICKPKSQSKVCHLVVSNESIKNEIFIEFYCKIPKREFDCFSCPALLVAPGGKVAVRPLVETLN